MASTTVAMAGIVSPTTPALNSTAKVSTSPSFKPAMLPIRASSSSQPADQCSRRALLSLLATAAPAAIFAKEALAAATSIKVEGPPPPSGGLPGTDNADQARDTDLPLKERFYLQPLSPSDAAARAKESAKDIVNVKALIDKKAWPYVQNDLRLKASYLRFDINTVIASKSKAEKKALKPLVDKLFDEINNLDYAARSKSVPNANKYYSTTVSSLNDVLAKLG
ncbi:hypothetical protein GOP47_0019082 [Adiantum capillus-veneris]|uniref:Uncharacterized protein n=1 Tax=Adiantum capillus-veneris TaxID=13818 RepID=A0A9D4Z8R6_ADICA|nr:hypothetical protein GOP47_0019082 [Adiantum capillus-veneris]